MCTIATGSSRALSVSMALPVDVMGQTCVMLIAVIMPMLSLLRLKKSQPLEMIGKVDKIHNDNDSDNEYGDGIEAEERTIESGNDDGERWRWRRLWR